MKRLLEGNSTIILLYQYVGIIQIANLINLVRNAGNSYRKLLSLTKFKKMSAGMQEAGTLLFFAKIAPKLLLRHPQEFPSFPNPGNCASLPNLK